MLFINGSFRDAVWGNFRMADKQDLGTLDDIQAAAGNDESLWSGAMAPGALA
jgi:hypothetical protein